MRIFEIVNTKGRHKKPVGWMHYAPEKKAAHIEIAPDAKIGHVPAMFNHYLEVGEFTIDATWTRKWVLERVPPASRHNIQDILSSAGLEEYDPYGLLFLLEGRSSQDDFFLRETSNIPAKQSYEYAFVALRNSIGSQFAQARKQAKLTQRDLAQISGIQQSAICKIENGAAKPTLETLECVAAALGMELEVTLRPKNL